MASQAGVDEPSTLQQASVPMVGSVLEVVEQLRLRPSFEWRQCTLVEADPSRRSLRAIQF